MGAKCRGWRGGGASLFIATPDQINLFEDRLSAIFPSLISLMVSVDVKHHVHLLRATSAVSIYDEHALVVFCRHTAF